MLRIPFSPFDPSLPGCPGTPGDPLVKHQMTFKSTVMTLVLLTDQVLLLPDCPGKPLSPAKQVDKLSLYLYGSKEMISTQMISLFQNCTNLWALEVQCHLKVVKRVSI